MTADFTHLHVHSEYSLLDGLSKIKNLTSKAKDLGMSSLALTDHGNLYGAIEFYKSCMSENIKPLLGMESYIVNGSHISKSSKSDKENFHLILLAADLAGYRNLMRLSTLAHLEGFYYRPRFSKQLLEQHYSGLICLSGCAKGEIAQLLINNNYEQAKQTAVWYRNLFGENYYLEIQRHHYRDFLHQVDNNPQLSDKLINLQKTEDLWVEGTIKLSRDLGIRLVATNDSHYLEPSDARAQDALVCISTGKRISDTDRLRYVDAPTFHLASASEIASLFSDLPDAVSNTLLVADKINLTLDLGKWFFPQIQLPDQTLPPEYLRQLAFQGLSSKFTQKSPEISKRMDFELEVIIKKGYAPYFLMMADMVNWCRDNRIITNTRGSAAGSLVSFCLGITTVDPIKYALPFERFLNPYRPKPPDIDLDIADDRREELLNFVRNKYGSDKVAQICTFGRMLARAAVRDIGRVLGQPYSFPDKIAKLIPLGSQGFPMTIKHALEISPELKTLADTDPQAEEVLNLAQQVEGNARHASVHAAGLVVSPTTMTDFSPLQLEPNGTKVITQYEMHAAEDVGLVKFDILGIRNLSILGAARDLITTTRNVSINLDNLPLDDKKTFSMLAKGDTMGIFQLAGSGMTKWLKELKPNRLEDIMVMIALFRPGPMANIPEYIARKNSQKPVVYLHPKMATYLDKSYGILVYQEDVLFTALTLAGYDWNSVDALRQAIGKKKPKEMAQQHDIFVKGCISHSHISESEAEKIWELFVPFQGYGFNKAHAASYGIVSYQTAFLKAHYPVEYMTALMTAESGNTEKIVEAVDECRRLGILVLPPDINDSLTNFTIHSDPASLDKRSIRFGFQAIKNVGDAAITAILSARQTGHFTSLTDFCLRVDSQKVNRKVLESLIKSGALDRFGKRSALLAVLDQIRQAGTTVSKLKSLGQFSLFSPDEKSESSDTLPDIPEMEKSLKLALEKELLGFYLTEHPHAESMAGLNNFVQYPISRIHQENLSGQTVITGGVIESCRNVFTKTSNQPMCFAKLTDLKKSLELVVFPKVYALSPGIWVPDTLLVVSGKIELSSNTSDISEESAEETAVITLIVDSAAVYTGPDTQLPRNTQSDNHRHSRPSVIVPVSIYIPKGLPQAKLVELNTFLQNHRGLISAQLVFAQNGTSRIVPLPYGINWNDQMENRIKSMLK